MLAGSAVEVVTVSLSFAVVIASSDVSYVVKDSAVTLSADVSVVSTVLPCDPSLSLVTLLFEGVVLAGRLSVLALSSSVVVSLASVTSPLVLLVSLSVPLRSSVGIISLCVRATVIVWNSSPEMDSLRYCDSLTVMVLGNSIDDDGWRRSDAVRFGSLIVSV